MSPFISNGISVELKKFVIRTNTKTKLNSPERVFGFKRYMAISSITIISRAFVIADTAEAAICTALVTRMSLERFEQADVKAAEFVPAKEKFYEQ